MAYRIDVDPTPANQAQLKTELEALAITGIRTYAIIGRDGEVAGVYPWSDNAPAGEYRHIDEAPYEIVLFAADEQRIKDAIAAHVPAPELDPQVELEAAISSATTLDELKAALLGNKRPGRAAGKPV